MTSRQAAATSLRSAGRRRSSLTGPGPAFVTEDPAGIRSAIMAAAPGAREVGDRRSAIAAAVSEAGEGDVVLVAGKGHETGQIVGDLVLPFDDVAVAREVAA